MPSSPLQPGSIWITKDEIEDEGSTAGLLYFGVDVHAAGIEEDIDRYHRSAA